jgi:hypothetical protein
MHREHTASLNVLAITVSPNNLAARGMKARRKHGKAEEGVGKI